MTEGAPEQRKIAGPTEPCCIVLGTLYCAINIYSSHLLVLRAVPCRAVIVMARMASHSLVTGCVQNRLTDLVLSSCISVYSFHFRVLCAVLCRRPWRLLAWTLELRNAVLSFGVSPKLRV